MASLKDLKNRIKSVKSTQKITKAMKMVAAAKLRRAQEAAEEARPYAEKMEAMLRSLAESVRGGDNAPVLLAGTGNDKTHLLIVATSDRGLCGGFNGSIIRAARLKLRELLKEGKQPKLYCIGRKGHDLLKREFGAMIIGKALDFSKKKSLSFQEINEVAGEILALIEREGVDVCSIYFNHFKSAISQEVTAQQLMPLPLAAIEASGAEAPGEASASYEFEPEEGEILETLLPRNFAVQIYHAMLENSASEQGARMTAMDNATRNAGEMIDRLSLQYNRTRQAAITTELTEIISGAEAL